MSIVITPNFFVLAGNHLRSDTTYILTSNLTISRPFNIFPGAVNVVVDGQGYTLTVPDKWVGLFNSTVTVKNLGILSSGKTTASAGWFFATTITGIARNCYSTGHISINGGGIFGSGPASNSIAENCYSTGVIDHGGGIFGASVQNCTALNCYSTGDITEGGGIFGFFGGQNTATNCYSRGSIISGTGGGGIAGAFGSSLTITNCYSTGSLVNGAGRIVGVNAVGTIRNTYATAGGLWRDATANINLSGTPTDTLPGAVWKRYNTIVNTPYILVSTPQVFSNNTDISGIYINNSLVTNIVGKTYTITLNSNSVNASYRFVTADKNATIGLSGRSGTKSENSGTLSGIRPGPNTFTVLVAAADGTINSYSLIVTTPYNNTDLSGVFINNSQNLPNNSDTYTYQFDSSASSVPFTFVTVDPTATISMFPFTGTRTITGTLAGLRPLANSFTILVTAQSGATRLYSLIINIPSDDAGLSAVFINGSIVNISGGTYTTYLDSSASPVLFRLMTTESHATASLGGQTAIRDLSGTVPLTAGSNIFSVQVTAQNRKNVNYPLIINTPPFSSFIINGVPITNNNGTYNADILSISTPVSIDITTYDPSGSISMLNLTGTQRLQGTVPILTVGVSTFTIRVDSRGVRSSYTLTISTPIINQAFINAGTPLADNTSYLITGNVTMDTPFIFDGAGEGITIDGRGHTITAPDGWPGLFSKPVTVQNVGILSSGRTVDNAGWFFQAGIAGTATNCYSTGSIGTWGGGIFGRQVFSGSATNCYSTGSISVNAGGIFGWSSESCSATNCRSTGTIDDGAGGIFGPYARTATAVQCSSTGSIGYLEGDERVGAGGIYAQAESSSAISCYSTGSIGKKSGGIFGPSSLSSSTNACYSLGAVSDISAGGIFGNQANGSITNCFGNAPLTYGGQPELLSITNCYTMDGGSWSDAAAKSALTGVTPSTVWYSSRVNTPYLLVANPEPTSNNTNLLTVVVNGSTLAAPYSYTMPSFASTVSLSIAVQPRATIDIQPAGISGRQTISAVLALAVGANTYAVKVTALDGVTSQTYSLKIVRPSLVAPTGLSSTIIPNNAVSLSWASVPGAATYNIYKLPDNTLVKSGVSTVTTTITDTRAIGSLYFRVAAVNSSGLVGILSDASSPPVQFTWAPLAPTRLESSSTVPGTVTLSWTPPVDIGNTEITSYTVYNAGVPVTTNIQFNGGGGGGPGGGGGIGTDRQSATITGLSPNIFYKFEVSATNSVGEGALSAENQILTTALSSSISNTPDFISALSQLVSDKPAAILNARAAINNAARSGTLTDQQRQDLTVSALATINPTGSTLATVSTNTTNEVLATMNTINTSIVIKSTLPVVYVVPPYTTGPSPHTATLNLNSTIVVKGSTASYATLINQQAAYFVFELPNSIEGSLYQLTLTNGAASLTLTYDGTVLRDQTARVYTANDVLTIGSVTIPLIGLGSIGTAPLLDEVVIDGTSLPVNPFVYSTTDNSVPVSITPTNGAASITVTDSLGTVLLSSFVGTLSGILPLSAGENIFTIIVTIPENDPVSYTLTITYTDTVPCFPTGTRILTVSGYKKVEDLETGELVMTADGLRVPVKIYEIELAATTTETAPFRVPKGTFGPAAPANDLILSPTHFFQIKKGLWMFPKHAALLSEKVKQILVGAPITYYHVECPQYLRDNLVVDGTVVESFGAKQLTSKPYTYNPRLKGYTRIGYLTPKRPTKA